jgi:hypothetical protein
VEHCVYHQVPRAATIYRGRRTVGLRGKQGAVPNGPIQALPHVDVDVGRVVRQTLIQMLASMM